MPHSTLFISCLVTGEGVNEHLTNRLLTIWAPTGCKKIEVDKSNMRKV